MRRMYVSHLKSSALRPINGFTLCSLLTVGVVCTGWPVCAAWTHTSDLGSCVRPRQICPCRCAANTLCLRWAVADDGLKVTSTGCLTKLPMRAAGCCMQCVIRVLCKLNVTGRQCATETVRASWLVNLSTPSYDTVRLYSPYDPMQLLFANTQQLECAARFAVYRWLHGCLQLGLQAPLRHTLQRTLTAQLL